MKLAIWSITLVCFAASATAVPSRNSKLAKSFYFECEEDGSFANPQECTSYYVCSGSQVFLFECPEGLHYDAAYGICDAPEAANCQIGTTSRPTTTNAPTAAPTTTTVAPTAAPTTTTVAPTAAPTSTTAAPTTGTPSTQAPTNSTENPTDAPTTTSSPGNPNCPNEGIALVPNSEDCTQFYVCIDGEFEVVDCPEGYGFSEELGRCDLIENVGCGSQEPECPSSGSARLPNPKDCGSYYFCINGNSALINCPVGLNFDSASGTCSADAECSLVSSTTSAPTSALTTSTAEPTTSTAEPTTSTAEPTTSTAQPTTTTAQPTTAQPTTTVQPTTAQPTTTVQPTTAQPTTTGSPTTSGPVKCEEDGELLPNPDSCSSFFQCANGVAIKVECPPGLEFNAQQQVCDNPSTANCSSSRRMLRYF